MTGKRLLDLLLAIPSLVLLAPLMVLLAVAVRLDSSGPAWFRQRRVGQHERPFTLLKFRTMTYQPDAPGTRVTAAGDRRITRVGRFLRRTKLDELPQLFNVLSGSMSLVGPRPEVPEYVAHYPADIRTKVLSVRPGMTDDAALAFMDEEARLGNAADPERTYLDEILPAKLALYVDYIDRWSLTRDMQLILLTLWRLVVGRRTQGESRVEA